MYRKIAFLLFVLLVLPYIIEAFNHSIVVRLNPDYFIEYSYSFAQ